MAIVRRWQERALDRGVEFSSSWLQPDSIDERPRLSFAPAIIVRQRDRNALVDYYDKIESALAAPAASAPLGLAQLLFPLEGTARLGWASDISRDDAAPLGDDPLFPLPTNPSQRQVLQRLAVDTAVVVQGPPGTGKTHTIANLTAALLAQGQRVLVTSQKDQALRVLRDKLPDPIQDLCVLLANSRGAGSDELERSVDALSEHLASTDIHELPTRISDLVELRSQLRAQRAITIDQMRQLREAEYVAHSDIAPGFSGRLARIAEKVAEQRPAYQWIAGASSVLNTCPLSTQEALDLRHGLLNIGDRQEARRRQQIPTQDDLPEVELVKEAIRASEFAQDVDPLARQLVQIERHRLSTLQQLVGRARSAVHQMGMPTKAVDWSSVTDWRAGAGLDYLLRRRVRLWDYVASRAAEAASIQTSLTAHGLHTITMPTTSAEEIVGMVGAVDDLLRYLANGGRLKKRLVGRDQRKAKVVLDHVRVDGRTIATIEDVDIVRAHLHAMTYTSELIRIWNEVGNEVPDGPLDIQLAMLADWADSLAHVQELRGAREAMDRLLVECEFRIPVTSGAAWDALLNAVDEAAALTTAEDAKRELDGIDHTLRVLQRVDCPPPELSDARAAIRARDAEAYGDAMQRLRTAVMEQEQLRYIDGLAQRLRAAHPGLAQDLYDTVDDPIWVTRLTELSQAWSWLVANEFCRELRAPGRNQELQRRLDDIDRRIGDVTAELAAAKAWQHCAQRITQEQRSALQTYKDAMLALGKATGRYTPRYRRHAREAMRIARDAVPAWVMTLSNVIETIPPEPNSFDVVIVDEASQVGIDAAFLLWLAPRVIVVGDDKQCAPAAIKFGELQKVYDRIDYHLPDLAGWMRQSWDPKSNLYQLLSTWFPQVIRLSEHFRCMPEIIGWSSKQFYDDRLVPLRQFGADRLPPLRVVHVDGGYTEGRDDNIRNEVEAKQIVETIRELLDDRTYEQLSFGVVVLQGSGQVRLIDTLLNQTLEPTQREACDLRVGTPPDFQGDERDVIFLSMVACGTPRAQTMLNVQRRFNVAASRAKLQMWLFSSVIQNQLKPSDLRHSLLAYMESPPAITNLVTDIGPVDWYERQKPFDSIFEQRVYRCITDRGYLVAPQVPVEGKRIDLVVVGANGRLAIECDGDAFHTRPEQVRADIERERELARVGWEFWRIRESEFAFEPDRALEPLWVELSRRGIAPDLMMPDSMNESESTWTPIDLPETDDEAEQ